MDFDLDAFEDFPAPCMRHARAGGKFRPKAKQRPTKVASVLVPSILPSNAKEKAVASSPTFLDTAKSVQPVDVVDDRLTSPVGTKESLKSNDAKKVCESVEGSMNFVTQLDAKRADLASDVAVSDGSSDRHSSLLVRKADSSGFDLDPPACIVPEISVSDERAVCEFQTRMETSASVILSLPDGASDKSIAVVHAVSNTVDLVGLGPSLSDLGSVESKGSLKNGDVLFPNDKGCSELVNSSSEKVATREDVSSQDYQLIELKSGNNVDRHSRFGESVVEVDSMGFDLDPFSDSVPDPSLSKVLATGKFHPRSKAQPRKGTSKAVAFAVPDTTAEKAGSLASTVSDNMKSVESVNVGDARRSHPVSSSLPAFESFGSKEPAQNNENSCFAVLLCADNRSPGLVNSSQFVATNAQHSAVAMGDLHSRLGKSMGENAEIFSGLESIHDFGTQSTSGIETPATTTNEIDPEGKFSVCAQNSVNSSGSWACNVETLDPVTCDKTAVQIDNGRLELEESNAFTDMETPDPLSEATIASKCCTSKSQPVSKVQSGVLSPDADESVMPPPIAEFTPYETLNISDGSIPPLPSYDALDYSSMSLGGFIPPDPPTSGFPMDEEQTGIAETYCSNNANVVHPDDVPGVSEKESSKSRKRKASSASNLSRKSKKSSSASEINGGGKSTRQLRKQAAACQLVDEPEDEAYDNGDVPAKPRNSSVVDEEDNNYECRVDEDSDDEYRVESTSGKKRALKKSKKPVVEKEKPVRKRKKANDPQEQSTHEPPKKFSHSTRRNKRRVNKDLLNMPEDEIDFQRLPIRDIIIFAEYKERLAIKEAKASKTPLTNQSNESSFHGEDSHNEEDTFASEQDKHYDDDQTNSRPSSNPSLFNYQSFMDKAPATRWSKQDTELFYEGIRQFGTDLSMIQQLFPGRTRRQVKSKLKKEERQHPLRLTEALNNRAKDHLYFEKVIEQLQEVAAQAEQESNRDDSLSMTGEEAELNAETNEEVAKSEQDEHIAVKDQEADVAEAHSSPKSGESDNDLDLWSSYKSEF